MLTKEYSVFDIHNTPEKPGIYGWFMSLKNDEDVQSTHQLFKEKYFITTVKRKNSHLTEIFEGEIKSKYYEFNEDIKDFELLKYCFHCFSPPLYIGIAKNLRTRLQTHYDYLLNEYNTRTRKSKNEYEDKNEIDTEKESEYFGKRMGILLKKNSITIRSLYIKLIELKETYPKSNLYKIELFLNKTIIPIIGRK